MAASMDRLQRSDRHMLTPGVGKLRHLDTHTLWIQQAVRLVRVDLRKVDGEVNPVDLSTKHILSRQRLEQRVELYGCKYLDGRAEIAPLARTGATTRATMAPKGSIKLFLVECKYYQYI